MANPSYDLGLFNGNTWCQWADTSGLVYYQNLVTQVTTYELPAGWEDLAGVRHQINFILCFTPRIRLRPKMLIPTANRHLTGHVQLI